MSGPSSPLQPFAGESRRDPPIHRATNLGPWAGETRVVPTYTRRDGWRFEVIAEWHGPGLPGLPPAQHADVQDSQSLTDRQLAVAIAKAAGELLAASEVPFLRHIREAFHFAPDNWRAYYNRQLGDTRAAASRGDPGTL